MLYLSSISQPRVAIVGLTDFSKLCENNRVYSNFLQIQFDLGFSGRRDNKVRLVFSPIQLQIDGADNLPSCSWVPSAN